MNTYFVILVSSLLVNNFVMNKFLGICPFLGVSKRFETAKGMGMAVMVVNQESFVIRTRSPAPSRTAESASRS